MAQSCLRESCRIPTNLRGITSVYLSGWKMVMLSLTGVDVEIVEQHLGLFSFSFKHPISCCRSRLRTIGS